MLAGTESFAFRQRRFTAHRPGLSQAGVVAVLGPQPIGEFLLQLLPERLGDGAPEQGIFVEDLDRRQRGIVTVALVRVGVQVREDIRHPAVHDGRDLLVEELGVGGRSPLRQPGDFIARLEAVREWIVDVEDDVDAVFAQLGDQIIQPVEAFLAVVEGGPAAAVAEILQPVHPGDVDALAAHPPDRIVELLPGEAPDLGSEETDRRPIFEDEPVSLDGDEAVPAGRGLDPPTAIQHARSEGVLGR